MEGGDGDCVDLVTTTDSSDRASPPPPPKRKRKRTKQAPPPPPKRKRTKKGQGAGVPELSDAVTHVIAVDPGLQNWAAAVYDRRLDRFLAVTRVSVREDAGPWMPVNHRTLHDEVARLVAACGAGAQVLAVVENQYCSWKPQLVQAVGSTIAAFQLRGIPVHQMPANAKFSFGEEEGVGAAGSSSGGSAARKKQSVARVAAFLGGLKGKADALAAFERQYLRRDEKRDDMADAVLMVLAVLAKHKTTGDASR